MTEQIITELNKVEQELRVKILFAVESGSRAWGFASMDSDWDVRFIYVHDESWYLSIHEKKDNYDKILPNKIDLGGWELRKALKLFHKSNPPLMEWLRSPIVYCETSSLTKKLRELSNEYFNPKSCLYHYLHMAEGNYTTYLNRERVRVKKYFYVLRPVLACSWIENTDTMPPMEFYKLVDAQIKDNAIRKEVEVLLNRKLSGGELDVEPKISILNEYLENRIDHFKQYLLNYDLKQKPSTEKLNRLFREVLKEAMQL